jgi:predicted transcriptional regulator
MTDITSISHAATIVAANLGNHSVAATEIPALIGSVHLALSTVGKLTESIAPAKRTPAISVRKSIQPNAIICPECGYSGQILGHLTTAHGLSVDEYRTRWGLARLPGGRAELRGTTVGAGEGDRVRPSMSEPARLPDQRPR